MDPCSRTCKKCSTVIGAYLLLIPIGLFWYWGNLSTYVTSYVLLSDKYSSSSSSQLETPWVLSVAIATRSVGYMSSEVIQHFCGRRILVLCGIVSCSGAYFLTYFTVSMSMLWLDVTLGGLSGWALGLMAAAMTHYVIDWSQGDIGTLTPITLSAMATGATAYNPFITMYINPDNLPPDYTFKDTQYFSDKKLLDRVPSTFLVLGTVSLVLQIIGFCMLRIPETAYEYKLLDNDNIEMDTADDDGFHLDERVAPDFPAIDDCSDSNSDIQRENGSDNVTVEAQDRHSPEMLPSRVTSDTQTMIKSDGYSALQMLHTWLFHCLWLSYALWSITTKIFLDYFKVYGQLWVKNDHYLNILVTTVSLMAIVSRLGVGVLLDRARIKHVLIGITALTSFLTMTFYYSPMVDKWFYFFISLVLASLCSAMKPIMMVVTVKVFGREQIKLKMGILTTSSIAAYILAPPILKLLLSKFGWFAVFAWASGATLLSLFIIIVFIPVTCDDKA